MENGNMFLGTEVSSKKGISKTDANAVGVRNEIRELRMSILGT